MSMPSPGWGHDSGPTAGGRDSVTPLCLMAMTGGAPGAPFRVFGLDWVLPLVQWVGKGEVGVKLLGLHQLRGRGLWEVGLPRDVVRVHQLLPWLVFKSKVKE